MIGDERSGRQIEFARCRWRYGLGGGLHSGAATRVKRAGAERPSPAAFTNTADGVRASGLRTPEVKPLPSPPSPCRPIRSHDAPNRALRSRTDSRATRRRAPETPSAPSLPKNLFPSDSPSMSKIDHAGQGWDRREDCKYAACDTPAQCRIRQARSDPGTAARPIRSATAQPSNPSHRTPCLRKPLGSGYALSLSQ